MDIDELSPHCCRLGFATELMRRKVDPVTIAWLCGWATPALVLSTYGHALKQRDLTDVLADTPLTQAVADVVVSTYKLLAFQN